MVVLLSRALCVAALIVLPAPAFAQSLHTIGGASSTSASGPLGGAEAGYEWQNGPAVFGFEADFSAMDLSSSTSGAALVCSGRPCSSVFTPAPAATLSSDIDWYGTVRGRLGLASGPVLFYATGGLAYGKVDLSSSFSVPAHFVGATNVPGVSISAQADAVKTGWVVGGGIDYMPQPNWVVSFGYQYVDLGTISTASPPLPPAVRPNTALTQNASAHAQFQIVTFGLSYKFASSDANWHGGYFGGHGGLAWGDNANANYSGFFFFPSCFTATTPVLMADGTSRPIAAVKVGDEVLGENGQVNRVVAIETPVLGTRKLYAFNDGPAFVTPDHPFMTRDGWKSISPQATLAENNKLTVGALQVGDELVKLEAVTTRAKLMPVAFGAVAQAGAVEVLVETKFAPLPSMTPHDGDPAMVVYNLRLDGNHTYFANTYLVHNK